MDDKVIKLFFIRFPGVYRELPVIIPSRYLKSEISELTSTKIYLIKSLINIGGHGLTPSSPIDLGLILRVPDSYWKNYLRILEEFVFFFYNISNYPELFKDYKTLYWSGPLEVKPVVSRFIGGLHVLSTGVGVKFSDSERVIPETRLKNYLTESEAIKESREFIEESGHKLSKYPDYFIESCNPVLTSLIVCLGIRYGDENIISGIYPDLSKGISHDIAIRAINHILELVGTGEERHEVMRSYLPLVLDKVFDYGGIPEVIKVLKYRNMPGGTEWKTLADEFIVPKIYKIKMKINNPIIQDLLAFEGWKKYHKLLDSPSSPRKIMSNIACGNIVPIKSDRFKDAYKAFMFSCTSIVWRGKLIPELDKFLAFNTSWKALEDKLISLLGYTGKDRYKLSVSPTGVRPITEDLPEDLVELSVDGSGYVRFRKTPGNSGIFFDKEKSEIWIPEYGLVYPCSARVYSGMKVSDLGYCIMEGWNCKEEVKNAIRFYSQGKIAPGKEFSEVYEKDKEWFTYIKKKLGISELPVLRETRQE